nr:unnamed protein product [Callosobruchus analis]
MSLNDEEEFQRSNVCHICEQPFLNGEKKVRDHDHLVPLNNYRGAAHEGCNINFKDNHTIPVVLHNLSGYDAHFIIKDIALGMNGRVDLLPITKERYIAFTKNISDSLVSFRFIDSFKFMNSSLDKLSSYLSEYPILKSELLQYTEEHIKGYYVTILTQLKVGIKEMRPYLKEKKILFHKRMPAHPPSIHRIFLLSYLNKRLVRQRFTHNKDVIGQNSINLIWSYESTSQSSQGKLGSCDTDSKFPKL